MKQAYTPALQVVEKTRLERVRELPLPGKALVTIGQVVEAATPVLVAELPGDLIILRLAERMGFLPQDVLKNLRVQVGSAVKRGQLLCEIKSFFGLFTSSFNSPTEGKVEFVLEHNAHVGIRLASIPFSVPAYIKGRVSAIEEGKRVTVETEGALIQGIFGVGGERQGTLCALPCNPDEIITVKRLRELKQNLVGVTFAHSILVGGAQFDREALEEAAYERVAGVITGSIDAPTLGSFVGYEIGVSVTGDEKVPFTLIVTEGFGCLPLSDRVRDLAKTLHGRNASINGATQVRAGATRPEAIVPEKSIHQGDQFEPEPKSLEVGAPIRCIRVPFFGKFGEIVELPHEPVEIESGAKVRVLRARLADGSVVTVPRANVELL